MLFDTHVHLNADHYEEDVEDVIKRALDVGVSNMVVVGFDEKTIAKAMELVENYEFLYGAVGWHPVDAVDFNDTHIHLLKKLAGHSKIVALGEMGLDYYWDKSPKEIQKDVFRKQIQLARELTMPIIIHNRDADEDVVCVLQEEEAKEVGGIMHCFGGSLEIAKQCLEMNFHISFGGPVTFKNARQTKEVAKEIPLDRLLIETDAPFLAPHPYRGKRNEPAYIKLVAEQLAEIKGIKYEELTAITMNNAKKLFGIS
ncbi:TatD family hydrolase [Evansella tamaricis]|uniref:TatD family hydrolase n=1 Tax=Evansella tamaricis TaxID=2069301 RepID=A0ABS6JAA0_9BACI|nr:TatD family hydrolase [Evansella tamaricis]MBU9710370.1 TatD family hydrolase [Evansella tamaricis]